MFDDALDQDAWLKRISYKGPPTPSLETLRALVAAHSGAIAYEHRRAFGSAAQIGFSLPSDQDDCRRTRWIRFEQNMLFRGGLRSLGYKVTSLQARGVRGLEIDAPRPMLHMVLRIDLPEGAFLADVGFGDLAPTRQR